MSFQHVPLFWNMADPVKPLNSYSAQINIDITFWNGSCLAITMNLRDKMSLLCLKFV